ncbi:hypothetical protein HETIRDRAFT_61808 [Heterobasidion irregulare TC 32-1]|uniref:Cdc23 domain-containing protein n=1 Tax=Heterobasidion irregulare (strain TC 32-1) TaxID=747525 RepID=W4K5W5_HETIT|nr:uncharacterized protein HETIRDRAFT_61808 [Heterobasidion irregulare TC 32-1]ETW80740.1 hypothetical protein HETIRDRAFT_61808 [Heterobasidion irregulare TC 32-1]
MSAAVTIANGEMVERLRQAVKDCADRGLHQASKWAAELLSSIELSKRHPVADVKGAFSTSTPARLRSPRRSISPGSSSPSPDALASSSSSLPPPPVHRHPHVPIASDVDDIGVRIREIKIESMEEDTLSMGKAYFDAREFTRAAHVLSSCSSARGQFLTIYSRFLASEKRALRDWNKLDGGRQQAAVPVNASIFVMLEDATKLSNEADPWILFLRGLLLYRLDRREEAIECTLLSLQRYSWNWSAWTLLSNLIHDGEELSALLPLMPRPPTHPLVQLFQVRTMNALHQSSENELGLCERLLGTDYFPHSLWIMSLRACVLYHLHDFGQAELQFQKILAVDPYRIDDIDIYSNILYVTENRLKLANLAHDFLLLDKDRPEVCCLVGNHYSLRAEHEKAYVEMKNSHAAIEAYRRAVDVNRKDYRAWYGLGQAYELLNMHQYALYYYQHATSLRPYDVRLWQAQGASYEEMGRLREAIDCFKRALLGADVNEITINLKLAKLHEDLEEYVEAAAYHRRVIDVCKSTLKAIGEYAKSLVFVARYHFEKGGGELDLAREYLEKVAASNSEEADRASDLLKKVRVALEVKARERDAVGPGEQSMDSEAMSVAPI